MKDENLTFPISTASSSRLSWPLVCASLTAMLAMYFTSGHSAVFPTTAVILILSQLTSSRLPKSRSLSWAIRAGVFTTIIAHMGLPQEQNIPRWYLNQDYTNAIGGLLSAEIAIRVFELPPAPGGLILLLSGLTLAAASNVYPPSPITLLAPIYILFIVGALRGLMSSQRLSRQLSLVFLRIGAAIMVIVIGSTMIRTIVRLDPEFQRWISDYVRQPGREADIGLSTTPMLTAVTNPQASMERILLIDGPRRERYLRVLAFDSLVNNVWKPNLKNDPARRFKHVASGNLHSEKSGTTLRFQVIGDTFELLPLPLNSAGISSLSGLLRDERGSLRFGTPLAEMQYEAILPSSDQLQGPLSIPLNDLMRNRCLELPAMVDPRIVELAKDIVKEQISPLARATQIAQYLRSTHEYSLEYQPENDPLADFILNNRAAHCQYFASALVVMCRAVEIPARFVSGYYAHESDGDNRMIVRDRDAHAWAECWIDGTGWITLDATPSGGRPDTRFAPPSNWRIAWERFIDFPGTIREWLGALSQRQVLSVVFACVGAVILIQMIQSRRKKRAPADRPYAQPDEQLIDIASRFEKWLRRNGSSCASNQTWREHIKTTRNPATSLRFIEVYDEARFGGADGSRLSQLKTTLHDLEQQPKGQHHG